MPSSLGSKSRTTNKQEGFTTIDDVIPLADELVSGLHRLATYKHPLAVRKGVSILSQEHEGKQMKGAGRTYFLDVEKTREGKPYMKITESRKGREGKFERSSILVFPEDVDEFAKMVTEMAQSIKK